MVHWHSIGLGIMSGMRSMSALAFVGNHINRYGPNRLKKTRFRWITGRTASTLLTLMAATELAADKSPFVPNRTDPAPLTSRIVTGALSAAIWNAYKKRPVWEGLIAGGVAAAFGTFAAFHLRRAAVQRLGIPDPAAAMAEDALVIGSGIGLLYE